MEREIIINKLLNDCSILELITTQEFIDMNGFETDCGLWLINMFEVSEL